jgi:hypothetical protein
MVAAAPTMTSVVSCSAPMGCACCRLHLWKGRATPATKARATPAMKARATPATKARATPATKARATPATKARATPATKARATPATKARVKAKPVVARPAPMVVMQTTTAWLVPSLQIARGQMIAPPQAATRVCVCIPPRALAPWMRSAPVATPANVPCVQATFVGLSPSSACVATAH